MIENMHSGILQGLICAAKQHLIWHINTKGKGKKQVVPGFTLGVHDRNEGSLSKSIKHYINHTYMGCFQVGKYI